MPFAPEFDDVYGVIKSTVESCTSQVQGRCFRLDESRPAGRITDRLLSELRSATFCVADLTGHKPNVMWEIGFAMALSKPILLITQDLASLPFDIKDMQSIEYDRTRLNASLTAPLRRSLIDTLANLGSHRGSVTSFEPQSAEAIGSLKAEIAQLRDMVSEVVNVWKDKEAVVQNTPYQIHSVEGDWLSTESGSHIYVRSVRGELVAPYCYGGNGELVGVYFGWRRIGDYWFAKFAWLNSDLKGFAFLRMSSIDSMNGAWWSGDHEHKTLPVPPKSAGVTSNWVRRPGVVTPAWVTTFISKCESEGVGTVLRSF